MKDKITRVGVDDTKIEKNFYDSLLKTNKEEIDKELDELQAIYVAQADAIDNLKIAKTAYQIAMEFDCFPSDMNLIKEGVHLFDDNADEIIDIEASFSKFQGYSSSDIVTEILFLINEL